jgi:hypothetical protein
VWGSDVRLRGSGGPAPAERLAGFRIILGVFVTGYLVIRSPVFLELGRRSAPRFEPVGVFRLVDRPLAGLVNDGVVLAGIALGIAFTIGWRNGWVVAAWLMHAGIYVLMLVGFPSPLFLAAFAPLFPLERLWRKIGVAGRAAQRSIGRSERRRVTEGARPHL